MTEHRGRAAVVVLGSGLLFGTTGVAVKLADTGAPALAVAAGRLAVGAIGLVVVSVLSRGVRELIVLWKEPLVWLSGLGVAGYMAFFFIAVAQGGAALASLVSISLSPVMAGALARLLGAAWPGPVWFISTALAIAGVTLLSAPDADVSASARALAVFAATLAGGAYAIYMVLGAKLIARGHHGTDVLAASFAIGAVILMPFFLVDGASLASGRGVALIVWLGLAATTTSYMLFGYGLTHLPAGIVATLLLSEPALATLLGVFMLGEPMPLQGWLGCALIATGLTLVARHQTKDSRHD